MKPRCRTPQSQEDKISQNFAVPVSYTPRSSVADPERFDADPDPTFQADADPAPDLNHFTSFFKSSTIVSKVSQNLAL